VPIVWKLPLPYSVVKFLVLNMPWRKGKTPTAREFIAKGEFDFVVCDDQF